jgi:hypothetical protein
MERHNKLPWRCWTDLRSRHSRLDVSWKEVELIFSAKMHSLRDQLVGAWELIEYTAYRGNDTSDFIHPMGPKAEGIIMYTPDGYM